ncbi:MAG: winged helix-turn-helix transcriptional regulator [Candidatus Lokiarchaeota archaeon]|nr:winged helix-turn-helix transcriptional regulator [Candidatus Lokiarchaeota archaeon]
MTRTLVKGARIIETLGKCDGIPDPAKHYVDLLKIKEYFQKNQENRLCMEKLSALGNHERLLILETLAEKDRCACELEAIIDKAQASVSHHIKVLEQAGLIRGWKKGRFTHYSLVRSGFDDLAGFVSRLIANAKNWFGEGTG